MKITIHKGGTAEYSTELAALPIPDLWHVVASCPEDREKLIECWHIAHALKTEMLEREAKLEATASALADLTEWGKSHTSPLDKNSPQLLLAACAALAELGHSCPPIKAHL